MAVGKVPCLHYTPCQTYALSLSRVKVNINLGHRNFSHFLTKKKNIHIKGIFQQGEVNYVVSHRNKASTDSK